MTFLAAVIAGAWIAGCLLLLGLMAIPSFRPRIAGLWPLMASEALIIVVGVGLWFLPQAAVTAVIVLGATRVGYEAGHVHGLFLGRPLAWPYAAACAGIVCACWFLQPSAWFLALGVVGAILNLVVRSTAEWSAWLRAICFPALPIAAFATAASMPSNAFVILLAFLLVELFDSFSVLGGRLFGRSKMAPALSPKKTWEGFALGIVMTLGAALVLAWMFDRPAVEFAALATTTVISALLGDLSASASKRRAGVKDYPAVLPVQGGLFDIVDAWIIAAPVAVLVADLVRA